MLVRVGAEMPRQPCVYRIVEPDAVEEILSETMMRPPACRTPTSRSSTRAGRATPATWASTACRSTSSSTPPSTTCRPRHSPRAAAEEPPGRRRPGRSPPRRGLTNSRPVGPASPDSAFLCLVDRSPAPSRRQRSRWPKRSQPLRPLSPPAPWFLARLAGPLAARLRSGRELASRSRGGRPATSPGRPPGAPPCRVLPACSPRGHPRGGW